MIRKPSSVERGVALRFTLNKSQIMAAITDPFWADASNIAKAIIIYRSFPGNQRKKLTFNFSQATPEATATWSPRARSTFDLEQIILVDHQGGTLTIDEADYPSATGIDFDALVAIVTMTTATGAPTQDAGQNGDIYFDQDTSSLYRRFRDEWVLETVIENTTDGGAVQNDLGLIFQPSRFQDSGQAHEGRPFIRAMQNVLVDETLQQLDADFAHQSLPFGGRLDTPVADPSELVGVLTGQGEPDPVSGEEGDYYIDLLTAAYYLKGASDWVQQGSYFDEGVDSFLGKIFAPTATQDSGQAHEAQPFIRAAADPALNTPETFNSFDHAHLARPFGARL